MHILKLSFMYDETLETNVSMKNTKSVVLKICTADHLIFHIFPYRLFFTMCHNLEDTGVA